jgi:hypothetical protein
MKTVLGVMAVALVGSFAIALDGANTPAVAYCKCWDAEPPNEKEKIKFGPARSAQRIRECTKFHGPACSADSASEAAARAKSKSK